MPTDPHSITLRRLLESATTVELAGLVSGVGTWSYLPDNDEAAGTITVGTTEVEVDGGNTTDQFTCAGPDPDGSGPEIIPSSNDGSIPGELSLRRHFFECGSNNRTNTAAADPAEPKTRTETESSVTGTELLTPVGGQRRNAGENG